MSNDEMPPQPKTQQLPAADKQEILLAELKVLMIGGFKDLDAKVDRLEANLELQGGEIGLVKKEVALIFAWKGDVDEKLKNNSLRAQATSSVDLDHEAKLGLAMAALTEEKAKREALEKNAATKEDVQKMLAKASEEQTAAIVVGVETLMKTPTAQKLKSALVPVFMVAITIIGIKLTMVLNKLQGTPATQQQSTVVQLAPAPITDAGVDQ